MTQVSPDQLKQAVESQHGGTASHVQSVPVHESLRGQTVWNGAVQVYDLDSFGVPTARAGSPFAFPSALAGGTCIAVSSDGARALVLDQSSPRVAVFDLGSDGTPTSVTGNPFTNPEAAASASGLAITF